MNRLADLTSQAHQKGTDKQFREWVRTQPSCISGNFSDWLGNLGEWRNPACHVRRAGRSGTAFKEDYACVALTHTEHHIQSVKGEAAVLTQFLGGKWSNDEAKAWFNEQRVVTVQRWIES